MSYQKEFQIFSSNINQAARAFYYHKEINRQIHEDGLKHDKPPESYYQYSKVYSSVQENARFWNDHDSMSITYTIIILGRVFDKPKKSHKIERLLDQAKQSRLFTNEELRKRKTKDSPNSFEWIDKYMEGSYELQDKDFLEIENFVKMTRKKWENIKDLRNKVFAHEEILEDEEKKRIYKNSNYQIFQEIISNLLTVEHIFWEAFNNGTKPDFNYQNTRIESYIKNDVTSLLGKVSGAAERT